MHKMNEYGLLIMPCTW